MYNTTISYGKMYTIAAQDAACSINFSPEIMQRLSNERPSARYWTLAGCSFLVSKTVGAREVLNTLLQDPQISIITAVGEVLYRFGERQLSMKVLNEALQYDDPTVRLQALYVLQTFGYDVAPAIRLTELLLNRTP